MIYYLNIGSNLGNKRENLLQAITQLQTIAVNCKVSSMIESEPWGYESNNTFVNVGVKLESDLEPLDMLHHCQSIERKMGSQSHRNKDGNYIDRVIDIDIILIDDLVIDTPELSVPHPHMHERDFVMHPLQELRESKEIKG